MNLGPVTGYRSESMSPIPRRSPDEKLHRVIGALEKYLSPSAGLSPCSIGYSGVSQGNDDSWGYEVRNPVSFGEEE